MRTKHAGLALWPLLTLVLGFPSGAAAVPVTEPTASAFDAYVGKAVEATALPGISVVVTHGDKIVYSAGRGHDSNGQPITTATPMRVASLSKSFTAMAVMTLVDAGKITLDEPVARQLPEFRLADSRAATITVRQLLNQTSGLSDRGLDLGAAGAARSLAGYVAALRPGKLTADPSTHWAYCNANYEVAARLVEVAGGMSFGDYLAQRVFGPLGMSGSAVGDRSLKAARGYNSFFGVWRPRAERAVAGGAAYLSPRITQKVVAQFRDGHLARAEAARRRIEQLTPRERHVLALVGRGLSNQDIGAELFLAEGTVKAHVSAILLRLGLANRVQAAIVAHEAGLSHEAGPGGTTPGRPAT